MSLTRSSSASARRSGRTSWATSTPTSGRSADIGLTPAETIAVTELVGNYVQGATRADVEAVQTEQESGVSDEEWWSERKEFWEEYFDPERFPHDLR